MPIECRNRSGHAGACLIRQLDELCIGQRRKLMKALIKWI